MVDLPPFIRAPRQHVKVKAIALFPRPLTWMERILIALVGGEVV